MPDNIRSSLIVCAAAVTFLGAAFYGVLVAEALHHGWDVSRWPASAMRPAAWIDQLNASSLSRLVERLETIRTVYIQMALGRHPAFPGGGTRDFWLIVVGSAWLAFLPILLIQSAAARDRALVERGQFGNARWATKAERRRLARGLELGLDPETQRAVRVAPEGNLVSFAPPRSGKTSGLIIPNLLAADDNAWNGAALVIDPKGEVVKAVRQRREALGRRVYQLSFVRGQASDTWNPLAGLDVDDALYLQRTAFALLPSTEGEAAYFRLRGSMFLAGVIAAAVLDARKTDRVPTLSNAQEMLTDLETLTGIAQSHHHIPIMRSLLSDLMLDDRSRSPLVSTASQAMIAVLDERIGKILAEPGIDLAEVARGQADLFVVVPTGDFEALAPLIRWIIVDLLEAVRNARDRADERLLLIVDEANSLGSFETLRTALGEMPGLGLSTWTFWQSRAQMEKTYGETGARSFVDLTEVMTVSNIGLMSREDAEHYSRMLGNRTEWVETSGTQDRSKERSTSTGRTPQQVPLMTSDELTAMSPAELVAILNSSDAAMPRVPLRLRKTRYFTDRRFAGMFEDVPPAARI